ncbi:MAG TPA: hypothetical protein VFF73_31235 [Planctomycetota bacterium]|nr:hypothetical protein [Planctomycetota bacterium]
MRRIALAALLLAPLVALAADKAKAEKALKEAIARSDSDGVEKACDELNEAGGKESLHAIVNLIQGTEGSLYWQLVGGASGFKDKPALEELGKVILSHTSNLGRDLLFALQNNRSSLVTVPLQAVLEKGKYDLQLMAVDQLAALRTVESVDVLIPALKRENKGDSELKGRIEGALKSLTGEDLGDPANWEKWWQTQRKDGLPAPKGAAKEDAKGTGTVEKPRDSEFHRTVDKLPSKRILVLASNGDFDHMDKILDEHKIPHTIVQRPDFDGDPAKYLKDCYALLVNCSGDGLKPASHQAIKSWVEDEGGFLYTEDWSLDVTVACWPDKVSNPAFIEEMTVKLAPGKGNTSHPLMRGVWQKPAQVNKPKEGDKTVEKVESPARKLEHSWKVDAGSKAIGVKDPASVLVLLESEELSQHTQGNTAVAITFRVGNGGPKKGATPTGKGTGEWSLASRGGRVLHTLSHWGHQPTTQDGQALHNMLVNFLLEAARRHEQAAPAKD